MVNLQKVVRPAGKIVRRIVMTQKVSDEVLGKFARQQADWFRRVRDGSLDPERFSEVAHGLIDNPNPYLRYLETVTLVPTRRDATLVQGGNICVRWLDVEFKSWHKDIMLCGATEKTQVDVYEMYRDGTYEDVFGSLGDPRELCLTEGQIKEFCWSQYKSFPQLGCATFFPFEKNNDVFIANVSMISGELEGRLDPFKCDDLWLASSKHRLVAKKVTN